MKKKLEKLLPKGNKFSKIKEIEFDGIYVTNQSTTPLRFAEFKVSVIVEEKKQKPEWIKCIDNSNREELLKLNFLYNAKDDGHSHYKINGKKYLKSRFEKPTKAEIEAHKLGFHVDDEVDLKIVIEDGHSRFPGVIESFFYDKKVLKASLKGMGEVDVKKIDFSTKIPPKQPIFQIDGKDMFEGDEFHAIDIENDWIYAKTKAYLHTKYLSESNSCKLFITKQDALNYVLEEAKKRFKGANKIKHDGFSSKTHYKKYYNELHIHGELISDRKYPIWDSEKGFVAKPIKEPKLMLGDCEVLIVTDRFENTIIKAIRDNNVIGQVTKEEWLSWYNFIKVAREMSLGMDVITGRLGVYSGTYYKKDRTFIIGCIGKNDTKRATLEQIEAITNELKKL